MAKTLLDLAKNNIILCDIVLNNRKSDDELLINLVGYHLQQAVEIVIKFLLEINGVNYPKIHDLTQLSYLSTKNNVNLYLTEYIDERLDVLSSWEAKTRYITNYSLELKRVLRMFDEVKLYIDIVEQKTCNKSKLDLMIESINKGD